MTCWILLWLAMGALPVAIILGLERLSEWRFTRRVMRRGKRS